MSQGIQTGYNAGKLQQSAKEKQIHDERMHCTTMEIGNSEKAIILHTSHTKLVISSVKDRSVQHIQSVTKN